jgi:hypothetical protein
MLAKKDIMVVVSIESILEELGSFEDDEEKNLENWQDLEPHMDELAELAQDVEDRPTEANWRRLHDKILGMEPDWQRPGESETYFLHAIFDYLDEPNCEDARANCLEALHTLEDHKDLIDEYVHEKANLVVRMEEMNLDGD